MRLSALELMSAGERDVVVTEWNRTERPYPRTASIPALFDAQVRARPDAEALVWGDAPGRPEDGAADVPRPAPQPAAREHAA